ncbi:unnamed protein product [Prorocentrum cordatum]|uniref:Uncharacterized protein n=1 Tax=Prorocentrum cordatum TaxID=2364126 RepID=A0ABN9S9K9_9DINO|nr:unnamed protein product [Polarella glacialis]
MAAGRQGRGEMSGGATPLFLAARGGHAEVIAWLLAKKAEVDRATEAGATPLYIAAHGGRAEAISRLLAGGAVPDGEAGIGRTPLHCAVSGCHTEATDPPGGGGAVPRPEHVWLCVLLGNVHGARRLAAALGYSRELWKSGGKLCLGLLAVCSLLWASCIGLLWGHSELRPEASVASLSSLRYCPASEPV